MSKLIYVVVMNETPIRAAVTREIAEKYIQCLKEEVEDDTGLLLYEHDDFYIEMLYLEEQ